MNIVRLIMMSVVGAIMLRDGAMFAEPDAKGKKAVVSKIAVIDYQKVADFEQPEQSASLEWRDLIADLKKDLDKRATKIREKQTELQKKSKQAEEARDNDEDTRAHLMKLQNEIEIDVKSYQSYSGKVVQEMQGKFGEKVKDAAQEIAQEQGWTHVIPGPLVYASPESDITDEVIERLNKKYRSDQRAKKFAKTEKTK